MGIRTIGIIPPGDDGYGNDTTSFLHKLQQNLLKLGAFGFENWNAEIKYEKTDSSLSAIISFNDVMNKIVIHNDNILVGDSSFLPLLKDIGLSLPSIPVKLNIDGKMAQLGDFKIRYGVALGKGERKVGILIDIEYLPSVLLSISYEKLFESICDLMHIKVSLLLPPVIPEPPTTFSFAHLGKLYIQLLFDISL